jgi:hypothetical protein
MIMITTCISTGKEGTVPARNLIKEPISGLRASLLLHHVLIDYSIPKDTH